MSYTLESALFKNYFMKIAENPQPLNRTLFHLKVILSDFLVNKRNLKNLSTTDSKYQNKILPSYFFPNILFLFFYFLLY